MSGPAEVTDLQICSHFCPIRAAAWKTELLASFLPLKVCIKIRLFENLSWLKDEINSAKHHILYTVHQATYK